MRCKLSGIKLWLMNWVHTVKIKLKNQLTIIKTKKKEKSCQILPSNVCECVNANSEVFIKHIILYLPPSETTHILSSVHCHKN